MVYAAGCKPKDGANGVVLSRLGYFPLKARLLGLGYFDSSGLTMSDSSPLAFTPAPESRLLLKQQLQTLQEQLLKLTLSSDPLTRAQGQTAIAEILLELDEAGMREAAWGMTRESFEIYRDQEQWPAAVQCCDLLYRCDLPASVVALGNGLWLAVTYPIEPQLTVLMLNHLIDATPANSDGAAVAAAVAHYIADIRLSGEARDNLMFLTSAMLGKVAERHSQVNSQQAMTLWLNRLQLLEPKVFLPRLAQILDAIVEGQWWYDRDELRARLPIH